MRRDREWRGGGGRERARRPPDPSGSSLLVGRQPVLELLRAGRAPERILIADGLARSSALGEIRRRAADAAVPIKVVPRSEIDKAARAQNHQGIVAFTARYRYTALNELLERPDPALVFLDGVTDPHNLGSLVRSAEGAGFDGVVIPVHRSVGVTDTVRRISAGAAELLPVARVANLARAIDEARSVGVWVVGLDPDAATDVWSSQMMERPVGLVLGAEGRGISLNVKSHCDAMVGIPLAGKLGSLNVAVAGAIAMFEVARRAGLRARL